MNLLLQTLGIWLWIQSLRVNGEVAMCFWILWFQSGYSFQTKVGPLQSVSPLGLFLSWGCSLSISGLSVQKAVN